MKNLLAIAIAIFAIISAKEVSAQYDEYQYWGLKVGATHSFLDAQPSSDFNNLFLQSPIGPIQLKPEEDRRTYVPGYSAGFVLNKDFKNDKAGFIIDASFTNYGVSAHYITPENASYWADVDYNVMAGQLGAYIKAGGREMYELQRYAYLGASFSYNLNMYRAERVSWTSEVKYVKQEKDLMKKYNFIGTAGINYMFFYIQADFVPGNFFQRGYQETLENGATIEPFAGQAKNALFFTTGINMPLNSWTSRKIYEIETTIKRWFN